MELQAVTAQLYVVDGEVQGGSPQGTAVPGILTQAAPGKAVRSRDGDFLFVHLTLTGQVEETAELTQELLNTISQYYYQSSGSITSALRRALIAANDQLLRMNLSSSGPAREGAITCAVLRHGELVILQTGESLALLGHNFGIERLPARIPDQITPFGRSAGLDIRYSHHHLQAGDMLLLVDPRLAHLPTQTFEPVLVDTEVEIGLDELIDIVGQDTARLLLVEFTDDAPADLPEISQPGARIARRKTPAPAVTTPPVRPPRRERPLPIETQELHIEATARKASAGAVLGLSRFTGWLARLMGRLAPPSPANEAPVNYAWATVLAIAIPIVVALVGMSVYVQRGQVQRMAEIKQEMGQNLVLAETAESEALRRDFYQAMVKLAEEADSLRPGDGEINRMRQQAFTALDRLDGVQRLVARPYYTYSESVNLARVALQEGFNGGIYTLDAANGSVYRHHTNENYLSLLETTPTQILFRQQAVSNHVVGTVIDLLWRPAGSNVSRDGLAMLDMRGALLTYFPNFTDTRAAPLGLSSEWQAPVSMAIYNERLYVLDAGAGKIWKYYPQGEGFYVNDEDRIIAFRGDADLGLAVDIDIYSEDASLVVLYSDGRIRYYDTRSSLIQWDENNLLLNGLKHPMVRPTVAKMVGRGLNTSIYVADPGSGRIIKLARSGTILAQYRTTDENGQDLFARITDFAVAETPLRIFVTAGNKLYLVTLE